MSNREKLRGVYVITDRSLCGDRIDACVRDALQGGVRLVQYRDKSNDHPRRMREACALIEACKEYDALLIVNDDIELARECGAHGVHLGREDTDLVAARRALGETAIIGVSCYNELARAERAAANGADYLAFGSVFESPVKPDAPRAPLALFEQARRHDLPICAIGGITAENISSVADAGADMAAVISAVFGAADITAASRVLTTRFR